MTQAADPRPNFLLIVVDDMGFSDLGTPWPWAACG